MKTAQNQFLSSFPSEKISVKWAFFRILAKFVQDFSPKFL